jgi:hypothetical protein
MAHPGKAESVNWTGSSHGTDALIVGCLLAVAGLGLFMLSPPAAPKLASEMSPAVMAPVPPKPSRLALAPQFYPWTPPQAYVPVLPERQERSALPSAQPPVLTRFETPRTDPVLRASDFFVANSHYACRWRPENVEPTSNGVLLAVHKRPDGGAPCTAAEMQTAGHYSYGRYEVVMRPARGSGLVSAFFTYTGGYFGDPHDEIDIEFVGTDTTRVHFNYFRKGKTGADEIFDLPFDAADADRLYAFEWSPEGITWFVDGEAIYATPAGRNDLPVAAGKIHVSTWAGAERIRQWTGPPTYKSGTGAHFSCVSFVPMGATGPSCADTYAPPVVLSP